MTITSRRVNTEIEYHCPFCKNHQDKVFYESVLIAVPICEGCDEELFHFCHSEDRPSDPIIEKVEQYTGKTWNECRIVLLRDNLQQWLDIDHERPVDWLRITMKQLRLSEDQAWDYVKRRISWYERLIAKA